jgi:hypothetical protein
MDFVVSSRADRLAEAGTAGVRNLGVPDEEFRDSSGLFSLYVG